VFDRKAHSLSPEQKAIAALHEAYSDAQQRLHDARTAFDRRADTRAMEHHACDTAAERGEEPSDATPEAFDLRWFVLNDELTRELISAEAEVSEARAALIEGGGQLDERDRESGFADHASDGYRMSHEEAWVSHAQSNPVVLAWLESLPNPGDMIPTEDDVNHEADIEDWDARSVDIEDSSSVVAEGTSRRRIDRWRNICGL